MKYFMSKPWLDDYEKPSRSRTFDGTYVKAEPDDDDDYGSKSYYYGHLTGKSRVKTESTSEDYPHARRGRVGYLSQKSAAVQSSKSLGQYPEDLHGTCFETTGILVNARRNLSLEISHMLFDTGASSTLISKSAANTARLSITECEPQAFILADGSTVYHDKFARFNLSIAGIMHEVSAYVDETKSTHHILIGMPTIKQFRARPNFSLGKRKETRWYVSHDVTGMRRQQFVLQEDSAMVQPNINIYTYDEGVRIASRRGETCKERNSREILERHEARGARLRAKHGRSARGGGFFKFDEDLPAKHGGSTRQGSFYADRFDDTQRTKSARAAPRESHSAKPSKARHGRAFQDEIFPARMFEEDYFSVEDDYEKDGDDGYY